MAPSKKRFKKGVKNAMKPPESSVIDYNQPESSLYERSVIKLRIGQKEYSILEGYLSDYPRLLSNVGFHSRITLSDIDEDIGHTFVHFIYTRKYETLKPTPNPSMHDLPREFRRSVQVYRAAMIYEIHGLEVLAKKYIQILGESIPIFDVLEATRMIFSKLPDNGIWLRDYIYTKLKKAFVLDETIFTCGGIYQGFAEDRPFEKELMRMMADIYSDTISSLRFEGQRSQEEQIISQKDPTVEPSTEYAVPEEQPPEPEYPVPEEQPPEPEYPVPEEQPPEPEYPVPEEQPPEPEYPVPEEQPPEPEYPVPEEQPPEPECPLQLEYSPELEYPVSEEQPFGKMASGPSVSIMELPEDIRLYVNWTNLGIEERKRRKRILKQKNLPIPHRDGTFS